MKKFYRYLIYKLYSWGLKKKGDTPIANVIITLTFVHLVQLFTLYLIALYFLPSPFSVACQKILVVRRSVPLRQV